MASQRFLIQSLFALFALTFGFAVQAEDSSKLVKVESKKVCMVNNKLFPTDQIPVKVDNKMYYGCCSMCKKTLAEKPESRSAIDPTSQKQVDKAIAVIGAANDGNVFYFENDKNFEAYNSKIN